MLTARSTVGAVGVLVVAFAPAVDAQTTPPTATPAPVAVDAAPPVPAARVLPGRGDRDWWLDRAPRRGRGSPAESLEAITGEGVEGAEGEDEIETDRDSFTPAASIAGRRRLIAEAAYSFTEHAVVKEAHSFPELLLRYGLTDRVELRLGWNAEVGGKGNEASGFGFEEAAGGGELERVRRVVYGVKLRVTDQEGWLPQSALILDGRTPTGGDDNHSQFVGTYVFGWRLPNRWKFDSAVRYLTAVEEEDHFGVWAPSAVLKVPLGERVNVHAEYFGAFSAGKAEGLVRHFFSPGVHWLVTPNFEVGVRVGWGLNDQSARFFTNAGFGLRF
ncbi:MAG TPA: transporter [Gemmata sp.]|nr:transporter [Gemmata sp.]